MSYSSVIQSCKNLNMSQIIAICKDALPSTYKHRPYHHPELKNGTALLCTDDGLNAYIAAYGEMHMNKCRGALQNFPYKEITGTVEIVDWGCGQGIGSMCVIEALVQHDLSNWLKRVTLIEPSNYSRARAVLHVTTATHGATNIIEWAKYLPGDGTHDEVAGIDYTTKNVIHVFSNILDISNIDLHKLANIVATSGHNHFILCMGPKNGGAYRIDQFCSIFGEQQWFSNIDKFDYGRTSDTLHPYTCKTKCFKYNGEPLNNSLVLSNQISAPIYSEYDPMFAVQNGTISPDLSKLFHILNMVCANEDIIILRPDICGDTPDIVVVRPNKGILLVTLFEEDLNDCTFCCNDGIGMITIAQQMQLSPLTTIDTYQKNLVRLHLENMIDKVIKEPKNWSLVKKLVVFAKNTQAEVQDFFKDDVNLKYTFVKGVELFQDKFTQNGLLKDLRFTFYNKDFDTITKRNFLRIITPQWHSYKEGKHIQLTTIQSKLSESVANSMQKISGVAGSGKTQVLATRAVNAQVRTGGDVLVLTYNIALANYMKYRIGEIRADFPWDKISTSYYHQFIRSQANRCGLHVDFASYEDVAFFDKYENSVKKYDAIFIDEVQDYHSVWLQILHKYFLKPNGEFVVFGDPKQNIYQRPLDIDGNIRIGTIPGRWNTQLQVGKRFLNPQLTSLAISFQKNYFKDIPTDNFEEQIPLQSSLYSCVKYYNIGRNSNVSTILERCKSIMKEEQLETQDLVIISQTGTILREIELAYRQETNRETTITFINKEQCQALMDKLNLATYADACRDYRFKNDKDAVEHNKKLLFTMDTNNLKFSTIHSYKGWESPTVIFLLLPEKKYEYERFTVPSQHTVPELIYTAITRARENLFIINLGNEQYHDFFVAHSQPM